MYCPKCSQQQVSEEVRFCSRCGFSLVAVRELIANGGALAQRGAQAAQLSPSQRGVRKGARLMLASFVLSLVVGLLSAINDGIAVLLILTILTFVIGFIRVLYNVFFAEKRAGRRLKDSATQTPAAPEQLKPTSRGSELPPARAETLNAQRIETSQMVRPPSVAESTTRLLDGEADSRRA